MADWITDLISEHGYLALFSVPAGFARMGLRRFLFWSSIGTIVWTSLLTGSWPRARNALH